MCIRDRIRCVVCVFWVFVRKYVASKMWRVACRYRLIERIFVLMGKSSDAMHVATVVSRRVDKEGRRREYKSHLVRRTFREDGKVKHQTLANISALPAPAIEAIRASLRGEHLLPAAQAMQIT